MNNTRSKNVRPSALTIDRSQSARYLAPKRASFARSNSMGKITDEAMTSGRKLKRQASHSLIETHVSITESMQSIRKSASKVAQQVEHSIEHSFDRSRRKLGLRGKQYAEHKVASFRRIETKKKAVVQKRIMQFGMTLLIIGIDLLAASLIIPEQFLYLVSSFISICAILCFTIMDIDLNLFWSNKPTMAQIGAIIALIQCFIFSIFSLNLIWGLGCLLWTFFLLSQEKVHENESKYPKCTEFISAWVLIAQIALNGRVYWKAHRMHDYVFAGCLSASIILYLTLWLWYRRIADPTKTCWRCIYAFFIMFGFSQFCRIVVFRVTIDDKLESVVAWSMEFNHKIFTLIECGIWLIPSAIVAYYRNKFRRWITHFFDDSVEFRDGGFIAQLLKDSKGTSELVSMSQARFRCVYLHQISKESFCQSEHITKQAGNNDDYKLSKPATLFEVDYFVSHSWHDDLERMWAVLKQIKVEFRRKYRREPSFWLDKYCIDQNNIADNLECLPIFVMGCKRMVVLWGDTYCTRLWCIMELYTFFVCNDQNHNAVDIRSLKGDKKTLSEELTNFDVRNATCFKKEDRDRMMQIIISGGLNKFNQIIRSFANILDTVSDTHAIRDDSVTRSISNSSYLYAPNTMSSKSPTPGNVSPNLDPYILKNSLNYKSAPYATNNNRLAVSTGASNPHGKNKKHVRSHSSSAVSPKSWGNRSEEEKKKRHFRSRSHSSNAYKIRPSNMKTSYINNPLAIKHTSREDYNDFTNLNI